MNNNGDVENEMVEPSAEGTMSDIPIERADAGASLPAPDEVRMSASENHQQTGGRRRIINSLGCYGIFFLLLVVIFIGLGVGLRGNASSSSSKSQAGRKFSLEALANYLDENGITAVEDILLKFATPQGEAARWMVNDDENDTPLPSVGVNEKEGYHFVTRYVLATIYYALSGSGWAFKFNFLSGGDICTWRGILFDQTGRAYPFGALCDSTSGLINALYLDGNGLNGKLPSELTALTTLRVVDFNFNDNIGGNIPPDIGKLSLLSRLALLDNVLTGPIPESICTLSFLETLHLGHNDLMGNIPPCIGNLRELEVLSLGDNQLSGLVPESLSDLTEMEQLWLDDNMLSGDLTTMFDQMSRLQALFVEDNDFQGTMDDSFLANHRFLLQVDLSNNNFIGSIPGHFFDPSKTPILELLDVHNNRLSGNLPDNIPVNMEMNYLSFYGNSISGGVPDSWANFQGLFHLDLSSNSMSGTMPEILGNITRLTYLFLANNTFTEGPIPASYEQLTRLKELSLKRTFRTGELPDWIGNVENMTLLDLDQNNFDGEIPESYGNMTKLQFLLLNRNNLAGRVPESFSQLTSLRAVFLEMNALTGDLDVLCNLPNFQETENDLDGTEIIAADCLASSAAFVQIDCTCCSICCLGTFGTGGADEGLQDETTCHDQTAIANLDPVWESVFDRVFYDFGNETRYVDRDYLGGN